MRIAGSLVRPSPACSREDLTEQARELAPLGVRASAAHAEREALQRLQGVQLRLQLHDGAGGGRLVKDARLGVFDLLFRRVVEIRDVVRVELRSRERDDGRGLAAPLEHLDFHALQPKSRKCKVNHGTHH